MVGDRRGRRLAFGVGLNCVLHGGRVPPQSLRAQPQDVARIRVPRAVRGASPVAGHEGPGRVSRRNKKSYLFYRGGAG